MAKHRNRRGNGQGSLFRRDGVGCWRASWYDHTGRRQSKSTGTTDKASAQRILTQWVADAALRREGVIDATSENLTTQSRRDIHDHLADFKASMRDKGNTAAQVELVHNRALRIIDGCGFKAWADVSASRVMAYLGDLHQDHGEKRGISAQTFNFYLQAVKQFGSWMVKDRRAADSPLTHLTGLNVRTDRRHDRRALTADELRGLIDVTATQGVERRGYAAADRAMLYRVAVETGLRRGELASLTRSSFRLDDETPTVTVQAAYSKHRRDDTLPLRPALVDALRDHLTPKLPAANTFNIPDRHKLLKAFKADLKAAGVIYRDASGKVADLHSLRHTFISNLASGGVHPKTALMLARHSTISLTMDRYTHHHTGDDLAALDVLPDLDAPLSAQQAKATGTDDTLQCDVRSSDSNRHAFEGEAMRAGAMMMGDVDSAVDDDGDDDASHNPLQDAGLCEAVRTDAEEKRRGRDSNSRKGKYPLRRFSKPVPSATRPPLQVVHLLTARFVGGAAHMLSKSACMRTSDKRWVL